ncbi:MAG: hypothetical protein GY809_20825 [Planctomycetes bacterium]|nr:hypothetical protein [Planctomycetota bacterium]
MSQIVTVDGEGALSTAATTCKHQTTPLPQQPTQFVTITHPYHPWSGQSVKVIHVQRGIDPDLLIQRPDGRHVRVAMSWTDYASSPDDKPRASPPPLLDVSGLCQVVRLIDGIRQEKRNTP